MRAEQGTWARMCLAAALGITLTVGVGCVSLGQSQDEVPAKKLN